ncbi:hypothetical protein R4282_13870 [Rhodococcus oxybenzonivorans]|jgi:hypothetical protein|uniref:Large secreted protein n=1 Tax=Rhodococcus oxybenzonivorans TaxID=1990687 RepID=A0A2S2BZL8_9NOCA|nr:MULTISPECIES: hypothetical protein [Rhodococcus]AWK74039.1 hypothetical protein CBI38_23265 [Rhodococcus oxybenzonivorans]MDV7354093.1 hypothetical protein [Rhodococcus oxybenzonivorans]QHE71254.1 putative large secreted protein [Rhodococcus sp. WAY2]QTJ68233.1 hypothetical protein HYG77_23425 [Rhodococcus sp. ZPP]
MRVIALAVLACLAVAGCGSTSSTDEPTIPPEIASAVDPSPTHPSSGMPVPSEVPGEEFGTVFTARPDIVRAHPTPFESWSRADGNKVAIHFVTGTPECYGADATVTETDTTVTISLRTGSLPESADKMCILVAVFGTLEVPLQAPLGDRRVING